VTQALSLAVFQISQLADEAACRTKSAAQFSRLSAGSRLARPE
jgi:hypothetical protein